MLTDKPPWMDSWRPRKMISPAAGNLIDITGIQIKKSDTGLRNLGFEFFPICVLGGPAN